MAETMSRSDMQETSLSPVSPTEHTRRDDANGPGHLARAADAPDTAGTGGVNGSGGGDGDAAWAAAASGAPSGRGEADAAAGGAQAGPDAPTALRVRGRRIVPGVVGLVALAALIVMALPGTQRAERTEAHPAPTATTTTAPTATPQATPLPTPLPGFALYVDAKSSFLIQYPDTWSKENLVPSIQFYDSTQSTYVVTILPADPNNAPPSTNATAAAMNWVDATLNGIQQEETVQNFERLSGPTPAVTIGGQAWQSGVATFGPTDAPNRVQVYATVFDGQPYVITLVAPDDLFETGQDLYFKPMLATFQFLTPSL